MGKARAVLVFPQVLAGGMVAGLEQGVGVMRIQGARPDYYQLSGASWRTGRHGVEPIPCGATPWALC